MACSTQNSPCYYYGDAMKRTPFARATGAELDENIRALRRMRVIVWVFVLGALCLGIYIGLFIAYRIYGGG